MSNLSYMEKLLDGAEVEWRALRDVVKTITAPAKLKRESYREAGQTPIIDQGEKFITGYTDEDVKALPLGEYVIFGDHSEHIKYVDFSFIQGADGLKILKSISDNPKYVYYSFLNFYQKELNYKRHWARASETLIPIPCPDNPEKSLAIQSEIVRILDKFTALTAELTAELNMRKKQYNYYRDQLLSFEEGDFEWMTLGDVTKKWYSGGTPTAGKPEFYEGGNIPWLRTQEVKFSDVSETEVFITPAALENSSAKWIPENCVIIAISGATAGRTAINKIPLTTNQHCGCLEIDDKKALYRYVFHWVSFNYENIKALGQGARGDLNSTIIKNFRLPVPYANDPEKSLAEQARIVAILDKFDTLTTSLQEGLPREIELRQKQYEYYRDLLLNFPKSHSNEVA
ncbi:restriction endonuclease subunit S [Providencia rettgeri]|nr:restriction endonuclease subunit S [Providencia rettgeri]MBY6348338.1 restriction endonuclease subunit S [Providencia rettgeri]HEC8340025.1 restriction endonuclease subunit S [Providencia rettgeri]